MRKMLAKLRRAGRVEQISAALDVAMLEERVLLSAAPMADAALGADPAAAAQDASEQLAAWALAPSEATLENQQAGELRILETAAGDLVPQPDRDAAPAPLELVFVDTGADDYQRLVEDLLSQRDESRELEVYLLDANRDGVEQISEVLAGYDDLQAVHLVSHGSDGQVKLGNTWLSIDNLDGYAGEIVGWSDALQDDGDLLIYGCGLASTDAGRQLTEAVGDLCGCDVAASADDTGHSALGGDWDLEFAVGVIETEIAFTSQLQQNWWGRLAIETFQQGVTGYTDTEDTYLDSGSPTTQHGGSDDLAAHAGTQQALIHFDNLFDSGSGPIPVDSIINSATLTLEVSEQLAGSTISIHQMLTAWDESSTWDSLTNGVQLGSEAVVTADDSVSGGNSTAVFDVTHSVRDWLLGGTNHGWTLLSDTANNWKGTSSEFATIGDRPLLTVDYTPVDLFVTNNTEDVNGNTANVGTLLASDGGDGISLREAILATNNTLGLNVVGFRLSGSNTITLSGALPDITRPLVLDGSTDTDFAGVSPVIEINGNFAATDGFSLTSTADGSTIRGLAIYNFNDDAIRVFSDNSTIAGNHIGTDAAGSGFFGNLGGGIVVVDATGNTIGGTTTADRNVVVDNAGYGIKIRGAGSDNNVVIGNYVGVGVDGSTAMGNAGEGIRIELGADNNTIGGTTAGERNVISTNIGHGVLIQGDTTTNNTVSGNYIGLDVTGDLLRGNGQQGIQIWDSPGNTIGGTAPGAGNVISANNWSGVSIQRNDADNNFIQGNLIGTDATGMFARGNSNYGIDIFNSGPDDNTIGGTTAAARNVISGNAWEGVQIRGSGTTGNTVAGNYIGTDIDGTGAIANALGGVVIEDGATTNTIGGTAPGAGNVIAFNTGDGVKVEDFATVDNPIVGNSIHDNTQQGIDLNGDGITANDVLALDADSGENDLQNYPVIHSVSSTADGNSVDVTFSLDSLPNTTFRIEFFQNTNAETHGEGRRYLGSKEVTTDGSGLVTNETANLTGYSQSLVANDYITATATQKFGALLHSTSEFSQNKIVDFPAVIALPGGPLNYTEGDGQVAIDPTLTVTDVGDLTNATVTILSNHTQPEDVLHFTNQLGITGSYDSVTGTLSLSGTTSAANYQTALRSVAYENTSANPNTATRTLLFQVTDTQGVATDTININVASDDGTPAIDLDEDDSSGTGGADYSATFYKGQGAVNIADMADAVLTDTDSDLDSLTVTITNLLNGGNEMLDANTVGTNILGSYVGGLLTLSGTDTVAHYQQVLRSITYDNTAAVLDTTTRVITFVANDGTTDSNTATAFVTITDNLPPSADAGGAYNISEGENLILDASASMDPESDAMTYAWDLDNDGAFDDATGESPTVVWGSLPAAIRDDGVYTIWVRADDGQGNTDIDSTMLTVTNTAPTLTAGGAATIVVNQSYTLNLSASDPGNDMITGWTINWGDGEIQTITGDPSSVTHTYSQAGFTFNITVSATDEDGTWTSSDLVVGHWVSGTETVYRYDGSTGAPKSPFMTSGGELDRPYSAIVGPDGKFYVSGYDSDNIVRFDSNGNYLGQFVLPNAGGLDKPTGMAFGPDGHLYVANYGGNNILKFDASDGTSLGVFGTGGGTLNGPSGIAWGPDGDLYVSSWNNGKLVKFDGATGGSSVPVINGGLSNPEQIVFDDAGNLYIADGPNNDVKKWDGTLSSYFSDATLDYATGLAFGPDGWLYVSSYDDHRVVRYDGDVVDQVFVSPNSGGLSQPEYLLFTPAHQVTITPNNAPTFTSANNPSIDENLTVVQTLTASDPESDPVTFTITGGDDNGLFQINGSDQLVFSSAPDYELPGDVGSNNVYEVEVTADDNAGNSTAQLISVTVDPVNDNSPVFSTPTTVSINENTTFVQSVNATDADLPAQTVTYSLTGGNDQLLFTIDGPSGNLSFSAAPDFESPGDVGGDNVYEVEVTANDNAGNTTAQLISVTVTQSNDFSPVFTTPASVSINENTTFVQTVNATDDDLPAQTVTYSLSGGDDQLLFTIDGPSGNLSFSAAPDFESPGDFNGDNVYQIEVTANDNAGNTTAQLISVTVDPVNDNSPVFTTPTSVSINENTTFVQTVNATDDDLPAQTVTYSLSGGNDQLLFTIDGPSGNLSFSAAPDFESPNDVGGDNVYQVEVTADDNAGNTTAQLISVTVDPVNDNSPVFTTPTSVSINENTTFVQTVNATDDDLPAQTVTYSLSGGDDQLLFTIDGPSGNLSFSAAPDFESPNDVGGDNVYQVEVTADDNAGNTTAQLISVTVDPVNDNSPVFTTPTSVSINENTTFVQTVNATDDDLPAQTVTYSLSGGDDQLLFTIDGPSGNLSFSAAPDFESPNDVGGDNVYQVEVTADDNAGNTTAQLISVTVDPVNDNSPVFTTPTSVSINENTTFVQTVNATDDDLPAQTVTYSLSGGNDQLLFTIDGPSGNLSFSAAPDFESPGDFNGDNLYEVEVTANDNAGNTTAQLISVTVTQSNDFSPVFTTPASVSINENTTFVQTVNATDDDLPAQTVTYSLSGGNDQLLFTIDGPSGNLSFSAAPDFESPNDVGGDNVYQVEVTADDNAGNTTAQLISVTVDPVNDNSPVFTTPTSVSINENTTFVQTVNATDDDLPAQTVTYSLSGGNDQLLFTIDGPSGNLSFSAAPDFESPGDFNGDNVYQIEVTANDNAGNTTAQLISVTVDPVNDNSPVFTTPTTVNVTENTTFVQTVNATDADLPAQTVTYSLSGGNDQLLFTIDGPSGNLSFSAAPDFDSPGDFDGDNVYQVEVTANDNAGNTTAQLISVTVTQSNDNSPVFTTPTSVSINENTTFVQTVNATDDDLPAQTVTYSLSGGNDLLLFTIDGPSGNLSFSAAPDFESPNDVGGDNVYQVEVTADDNAGNTTAQLISVTVDPVNDNSPVFTTPASVSINENTTFVQTVNATDADLPAQTVTYSLSGGDDLLLFTIDGPSGNLSFSLAPDFASPSDFDGDNVYQVEVTADDNAGNTTAQLISVSVTQSNDFSPVFTTPASVSINENTTFVQTVNATDADLPAQTVTYSLSGGNDQLLFTIDGPSGNLTFSAAPDFEVPSDFDGDNVYEVEVTADDNAGNTTAQLISVTVTNANEDPVITSAAATSIAENTTAVMTVTSTDVDGGAAIYSINGGSDATRFAIDAVTGGLRFRASPNFEFPTDIDSNNVYQVGVRVDDGNGGSDVQLVDVTVTDANDAPTADNDSYSIGPDQTLDVASPGVLVGDVDEDGHTLAVVVVGGPSHGTLVLNSNGSFVYVPDKGFSGADTFTYQVDDSNGGTATATVSINVVGVIPDALLPQPEAPKTSEPPTTADPPIEDEPVVEPPPAEVPPPSLAPAPPDSSVPSGRGSVPSIDNLPEGPSPSRNSAPPSVQNESSEMYWLYQNKPLSRVVQSVREVVAQGVVEALNTFTAPFNVGLLWNDLSEIQNGFNEDADVPFFTAGSVAGVSSVLTVGYVLWTIRSGLLATSLLAQMPAWRLVDPLVVLEYLDQSSDTNSDDEESIESLLANHEHEEAGETEDEPEHASTQA